MDNPDWKSCSTCGAVRSTLNSKRLKDHLLVRVLFLLSTAAEVAAVKALDLRQAIQRARSAPPSGMGQSTLTMDKSSVKRKLMKAFADELTQSEAKKLQVLFAEMDVATNMPHSWVEHGAVQKVFNVLRPAFQLPSRYKLSTPLLLGVSTAIATQVNRALGKHKWLTIDGITMDGHGLKDHRISPTTMQRFPEPPISWTSRLRARSRSQASPHCCAD